MKIRVVHDSDLDAFPDCHRRTLGAPRGMEKVVGPAEVLMSNDGREFHFPWEIDEEDIARLVAGGTIWISMLGVASPHNLEVKS